MTESVVSFNGSWLKVEKDKAPQISYNEGKTWEDIDFSDTESREFKVFIPNYIYSNSGGKQAI